MRINESIIIYLSIVPSCSVQEVWLVFSNVSKQNKKKERKKEGKKIICYFYIIIYCVRSMPWFTFLCLCVWFLPTFQYRRPKKRKKKNLTIDLFSLCVLFSQIRGFAFWLSLIMHTYADARARTTFGRNSCMGYHHVVWSGKNIQNKQAKKVYSYVLPLVLVK